MPTNETIFLLLPPTLESDPVDFSIASCGSGRKLGIPVAHMGWRIMAKSTREV